MVDSVHCEHTDFDAFFEIGRLTDGEGGKVTSYIADVRFKCKICHLPFQFMGLELGLNLRGATMSPDGQQARLSIFPVGSVPQPLDALLGYRVALPGKDH